MEVEKRWKNVENCSSQMMKLVKVKKEVEILENLNHGYIVSYVESFEGMLVKILREEQ